MAASHAAKEALWLRTLLQDFNLNIPTVEIRADNQSALKLLKHPVNSARSKHIDVMHHFVRERVARGEIVFNYISTELQVADILTKALSLQKLIRHRFSMGIKP